MNVRRTLSATVLAGGLLVLGAASPAAAACDAYSGTCTQAPPTQPVVVLPTVNDRDETSSTREPELGDTTSNTTVTEAATLPFTGGELVLLTAVGAGALAGGIALVAAGRRRKPDTAA